MVGSPCLTMAHLPIFDNTLQEGQKGGQLAWVWLMFVVIGGCGCLLLPLWCFVWTLAMFGNTATTMVGSPCLTMAHWPIQYLTTLSRKEKRGAVGLGMADVCCDWWLWLPSAAFVVFFMYPSNVWQHCHNNGWLSLSHNGPLANTVFDNTLQEGKKGGSWPGYG